MKARSESGKEPKVINIDKCYTDKIDEMKEKHKGDPNHYISRLELKQIYLFAIVLALKRGHKPKRSEKPSQLIRNEYLNSEDRLILRSLIFSSCDDMKILLPENAANLFDTAERLANAGMGEIIELLEDSEKIEKMILVESGKIPSK